MPVTSTMLNLPRNCLMASSKSPPRTRNDQASKPERHATTDPHSKHPRRPCQHQNRLRHRRRLSALLPKIIVSTMSHSPGENAEGTTINNNNDQPPCHSIEKHLPITKLRIISPFQRKSGQIRTGSSSINQKTAHRTPSQLSPSRSPSRRNGSMMENVTKDHDDSDFADCCGCGKHANIEIKPSLSGFVDSNLLSKMIQDSQKTIKVTSLLDQHLQQLRSSCGKKEHEQQSKEENQFSSWCHIVLYDTFNLVLDPSKFGGEAGLQSYEQIKSKNNSKTGEDRPFLEFLRDQLVECNEFGSVSVLKGGYLDFNGQYPELCESVVTGADEGFGNAHESAAACSSSRLACSRGFQAASQSQSLSGVTTASCVSQPCLPSKTNGKGPTKILPFMYLGSQKDSLDDEMIKKNGITNILNLSVTCPKPEFIPDGNFLRIPVNDSYTEKLIPHFDTAFQYLDKVRENNGCVLVHCLGGVSRSPTVAIAYIMQYLRMSQDEAYKYVKDKRPNISPNFNFLGQLMEYERQLREKHCNDIKNHQLEMDSFLSSTQSPMMRKRVNTMSKATLAGANVSSRGGDRTKLLLKLESTNAMKRSFSCPVKLQKLNNNDNQQQLSFLSCHRNNNNNKNSGGGVGVPDSIIQELADESESITQQKQTAASDDEEEECFTPRRKTPKPNVDNMVPWSTTNPNGTSLRFPPASAAVDGLATALVSGSTAAAAVSKASASFSPSVQLSKLRFSTPASATSGDSSPSPIFSPDQNQMKESIDGEESNDHQMDCSSQSIAQPTIMITGPSCSSGNQNDINIDEIEEESGSWRSRRQSEVVLKSLHTTETADLAFAGSENNAHKNNNTDNPSAATLTKKKKKKMMKKAPLKLKLFTTTSNKPATDRNSSNQLPAAAPAEITSRLLGNETNQQLLLHRKFPSTGHITTTTTKSSSYQQRREQNNFWATNPMFNDNSSEGSRKLSADEAGSSSSSARHSRRPGFAANFGHALRKASLSSILANPLFGMDPCVPFAYNDQAIVSSTISNKNHSSSRIHTPTITRQRSSLSHGDYTDTNMKDHSIPTLTYESDFLYNSGVTTDNEIGGSQSSIEIAVN